MDVVQPAGATYVEGREFMFRDLPAPGWRVRRALVDAAHLGRVGRNITAATTLGMAQHTKRPPPMSIICRLS
jgi:hypothetical protein